MSQAQHVTGEIMRLRPVVAGDAAAFLAGAQDPEVVQQISGTLPASLEQAQTWAESVARDPRRLDFAITSLDDDAMIGEIVLDELDLEARRARLHMWMLPGSRGRGYGREAIYRVLELAFEPTPGGLGLHRVGLMVPSLNPRARSLYESFGFRDEGRLRDYFCDGDAFTDAVVMGLLEQEFEAEYGMFTPHFASSPAH